MKTLILKRHKALLEQAGVAVADEVPLAGTTDMVYCSMDAEAAVVKVARLQAERHAETTLLLNMIRPAAKVVAMYPVKTFKRA